MTDLAFCPPNVDDPPVLEWPGEGCGTWDGPTSSDGFSLWIDDSGWRFPCVYTVGLTDYGLPELVFFGQDTVQLRQQWGAVQGQLKELVTVGQTVRGGPFDALVSAVSDENLVQLGEVVRRFGPRNFTAVQMYWVVGQDSLGPSSSELSFLAGQPYLGRGTLRELLGRDGI